MSPKICFVTNYHPRYNLGGAEIQSYYLANEFSRRYWDVSYISFISNNTHSEFSNKNIQLHSISRVTIIDSVFKIVKTLFQIKPDVIYCRLACEGYIASSIYKKINHCTLLWCPGHDIYCNKENLYRHVLSASNNSISKIRNHIFYYGILWSITNTDIIFSQNKFQKKALESNGYSKPIHVDWNAHPVPELNGSTRNNTIFWASNFNLRKRFKLFCDLSKRFNGEFEFVACGKIPKIKEVERKSKALLKANPQVNYLGEVSLNQVNDTLTKCKLLIITSKSEGFPNIMIQSLLRGTPVLTFGVDPDKIIKENGLGWVCSDLKEAEYIIRYIDDDPEYFKIIMKRCREFAIKHFSIERAVDSIIDKI